MLTNKLNWNQSKRYSVGKHLILKDRWFTSSSLLIKARLLISPKNTVTPLTVRINYRWELGSVDDDVFIIPLDMSSRATIIDIPKEFEYQIVITNNNSPVQLELSTLKSSYGNKKDVTTIRASSTTVQVFTGGGNDEIGSQPFVFTQNIPAAIWTVNHNLGYFPDVRVYDVAGNLVICDIQHVTPNQTLLSFNIAQIGSANFI